MVNSRIVIGSKITLLIVCSVIVLVAVIRGASPFPSAPAMSGSEMGQYGVPPPRNRTEQYMQDQLSSIATAQVSQDTREAQLQAEVSSLTTTVTLLKADHEVWGRLVWAIGIPVLLLFFEALLRVGSDAIKYVRR